MSEPNSALPSELLLEMEVASDLCKIVNTPRALAVFLMLKYQEFGEIVSLAIDPSNYQDPRHFADDLLVTKVLQKSPNLPLGIDRVEEALQSFERSEVNCKRINDLFSSSELNLPPWVFGLKREVHRILGPLTGKALDFMSRNFKHGPGATVGVKGRGQISSDKYNRDIHLTANLVPFYRAILGDRWWEHQPNPQVVQGSTFGTVPKSAKTDRGICVEPTLNMYVQKGIGTYLNRRLKRFGIDLSSQSRNQHLAQRAYSDNLATIDLSAASDSVSLELVRYLVPPDWMHLFEVSRCQAVKVNDEFRTLEKISSMGNGFTFELETLVFFSVCRLIIPHDEFRDVSVYGDDIIVPQKYAQEVIDALNFLGFKVNTEKSFLAGNFFESCGTDWFKGTNVRPFFLKGSNEGIPYPVQIANALRIYSHRVGVLDYCDGRFRSLWIKLLKKCPPSWRQCRVPPYLGDVGIITSQKEAFSKRSARDGVEGFEVRTINCEPVYCSQKSFGLLLLSLARQGVISYSLDSDTEMFNWSQFQESGFRRLGLWSIDRTPITINSVPHPTGGKLPRRGYLGKPRSRFTFVHRWCSSFEWDSTE